MRASLPENIKKDRAKAKYKKAAAKKLPLLFM